MRKSRRFLLALTIPAALFLLVETGLLLRFEKVSIRAYQKVGAPVASLVATCRFEPTCSHHALEVLESNGFWMGNLLIGKRLLQCSPLGLLF